MAAPRFSARRAYCPEDDRRRALLPAQGRVSRSVRGAFGNKKSISLTNVGMTRVGGGSLMTLLLVLLFSVHPATAVGTDLLYAGLTKSVGTAVHDRKGGVDWRIVSLLAAEDAKIVLAGPLKLVDSGRRLLSDTRK